MKRILIINGPNLNLLGRREPDVYGNQTFEQYHEMLQREFRDVHIDYYQSNIEGKLVSKLHDAGFNYEGAILNAGAYTHTSIAIGDAVKAIDTPVIEVHISNVYAREPFRHHSYISPAAAGVIIGFGLDGYRLAILALIEKIK